MRGRPPPSHPKYAELRPVRNWRVQRGGEGEAEDVARLRGVDDAVVPQPGGRVPRIALRFIIVADRLLEGFRLFGRPFVGVAVDGGEDAGGLLSAHDADAAVGPGKQETRR